MYYFTLNNKRTVVSEVRNKGKLKQTEQLEWMLNPQNSTFRAALKVRGIQMLQEAFNLVLYGKRSLLRFSLGLCSHKK